MIRKRHLGHSDVCNSGLCVRTDQQLALFLKVIPISLLHESRF